MQPHLFLGRYEAVRHLGQGGMGRVYLARDRQAGRDVVVKVLRPDLAGDPKFLQAFRREIDFMARFRHPNVVELYEGSPDDPQGPCVVMEYVPGQPLDELLERRGRFTARAAGHLLGQLCSALQAAHARGIVHRDLKPANLMVVEDGSPAGRLKVLDFGLAKLNVSVAGQLYIPMEQLTSSSVRPIMGTPEYVCPEQIRGEPMDHRGDIYSVGVILFELLSGTKPFKKKTADDTALAHVYDPVPRLDLLGPTVQVRPAVEAVVRSCMAKDVAERPQNAWDLAKAYESALGEKIFFEETFVAPSSEAAPADGAPAIPNPEDDPHAVVSEVEAWMPESVAVVKLRGFLDGRGAEVLESVPGVLRVRLKRPRSVRQLPRPAKGGFWSLFGLGKPAETDPGYDLVDLDVYLRKEPSETRSQLRITLVLRPAPGVAMSLDGAWQEWCDQVHRELKAYVMA